MATRAAAQDEAGLLADEAPERDLNAIMLQSAPNMVNRLADHLDLAADGLHWSARPGERVVFGASAALRHTLAGDGSSLTFVASRKSCSPHRLAVVSLNLARDSIWDGLEDAGFIVSRRDTPVDALREVGALRVPFAVTGTALAGADKPDIDRRCGGAGNSPSCSSMWWIRNPPPNAFPTLKTPEWVIQPRLRELPEAADAALARALSIRLPVAVPPRETPKLVAAGIALSPYRPGP